MKRSISATRPFVVFVVAALAIGGALFSGTGVAHASQVNQYNYTGGSASYSSQGTGFQGIAFSTDGTQMYLTSYPSASVVYQYTLGTAWNISTASYTRSYNLHNTGPQAMQFSSDGTKMYVSEFYNALLDEYTLSTPWNISTATYTLSKSLPSGNNYTFVFKSDGSQLYDFDQTGHTAYEFTLGTNWDLSTLAASASSTYSFATDSNYIFGAAFSSDGSTLYAARTPVGGSAVDIRQYNLSTPWLISTASSTTGDLSTSYTDASVWGVTTNPSNNDLYFVGQSKNKVYWYSLSAADVQPPTVSMNNPNATTTMLSTANVQLSANVSDNQGVSGVTFYVNGVQVGSTTTISNGLATVSWDSTATSSGSHTFYAVAQDTSGNYATSTIISALVENGTPSTQASNVSMTNISAASSTISWTNGNGGARDVFIAATSTPGSPLPVNNTTYTASSTFGFGSQIGSSGWYNVYSGTSTSVTVSNLMSSNAYQVMVVEYNGQPGAEQYLTSSATGNPYSKAAYTGTTYYSNSATGNDTTGTGSSGNPYKSFTKAYNAAADGDTINLNGTFIGTNESGAAIITGNTLNKSITITGQSASSTIFEAATSSMTADQRIFSVAASTTVMFENIAFRYGRITGGGYNGACFITSSGDVVTFLNDDIYSCYQGSSYGGVISTPALSTTTIDHSSIHNNFATAYGGAILNSGNIFINDSTFFNNTAATSYGGSVLYNTGTAWLTNSTITNNMSYEGTLYEGSNTTIYLRNTIVASDTASIPASADLYKSSGLIVSEGYNILGRFTSGTIATSSTDWTDPSGTGTFKLGTSTTSGSLLLSASSSDPTYGTYTEIPQLTSIAINNATSTSYTASGATISMPTTDQVYLARSNPYTIGAANYQGGLDTTPPTVSMTAPTSLSTVSGSAVSLTASASDNAAVAGVTLYVDGTKQGSQITTAPYTYSWNSTATTSGTHTAFAVAVDTSNNYATSSPVSFTVSNPGPVISSIASSTTSSSATITWSTASSSNSQINYGTTSSYGTASSSASFVTSHTITLTGLSAASTYHFQIQNTDALNNTSTSSDYTFTTATAGDITAPIVTVTAPTLGATVLGNAVTLMASSTDDVAVGGVTFYIDGTKINTEVTSSTTIFSTSWNSETASNTSHSIVAVSRDTSNNYATSTAVSFTVDNTPPIPSNIATSTTQTTATISWISNKSSTSVVAYGLTTSYGTASSSPALVTNHSITLSGLTSSTTYDFAITDVDSGGNAGTTGNYTFTTASLSTPTISNLATTTNATSATITFNTSVPTNVAFQFGTTTAYGTTLVDSAMTSHAFSLSSLVPSTTYHFIITAVDSSSGATTTSSDYVVVTSPLGAATPTSIATVPSTNSVQIQWTTPVSASSQVVFGPTSTYGSSTPETDIPSRVTSHPVVINGLVSCTLYHYVVEGSNASDATSTSADNTFTTTGCTGNATVNSTQEGTIPVSTGGTVTNGAFSLSIPTGFTTATTSAVFQVQDIDRTAFFASAGAPAGKQAATSDVFTTVALSTATTTLSTFASPLTITLSYTSPQISGLDPSTLWIYRYDSGVWTALSACTTNSGAQTVTCQTQNFSDFALFGTAQTSSVTSTSAIGGSVGGGTSVTQQVATLIAMGNTARAQQIESQWPQLFASSSIATVSTVFTRSLTLGSTGADVKALQQYLNTHGFNIATTGAGSPGNETTYFGKATKAALAAFQKAHSISPSAGYFGSLTRTYIMAGN